MVQLVLNLETSTLKVEVPRFFIRSIETYTDRIEIWGNYIYQALDGRILSKTVNICLYDSTIDYYTITEALDKYLGEFANDPKIMAEKFLNNEDERNYETETHKIKVYFSKAIIYPDIIVMEIYNK